MADFMTVLAASQKQAPTGPHGKALASLLPGGLFESVLSAQIGAATDGEAGLLPLALPLSLPLALPDALMEPAKPVAKKTELSAAADTDLSATLSSTPLPGIPLPKMPLPGTSLPGKSLPGTPLPGTPLPGTPLPGTQLEVSKEQISLKPDELAQAKAKPVLTASADTDPSTSFPNVSLPITPLEMSKGQDLVKQDDLAEATAKPVHPAMRPLLEMAATPAATAGRAGQELPPGDPQTQSLGANAAGSAAVAGTSLAQVAVEVPAQAGQGNDHSDVNAVRQFGHFEHLARAPETRLQAAVEAPVRSQGFPAEFSEKIVWLVGRQSQVADLSLNPPQLGSLEVRLSLSGSEAGAQFYSPNPMVRDAIEAALPRLRELMAQAGIALGDAQVRDEAFARNEGGGGERASGEAASGEVNAALAPAALRTGLGLVDLYV